MSRVVFLLEERSMKVLLDGLLPRIFPQLQFLCVPHQGRHDLEQSIPRKLRGWREPGVRFVVLRDNDGGNCLALKERLRRLCGDAGRADTVVRIACQELEAWYLGEPEALAEVFGEAIRQKILGKSRFRDCDTVLRPAAELERLIPEFQKVSGARRMATRLQPKRNRSPSFRALLRGIERLLSRSSERDGDERTPGA